jgi:hypothetical protein
MNTLSSIARGVLLAAVLVAATAPLAQAHDANIASYFVGVDSRPFVIGGTYDGLANPNLNRLTFLYAHTYAPPDTTASTSNHYHSKGTQIYTGPVGSPTVITTTNNYLPEGSIAPLTLSLGTGVYAGKLVSAPIADPDPRHPFSLITIEDTGKLRGFGSTDGQTYLLNSSTNRWNTDYTGADIHLELVSLTAGLNIGTSFGLTTGLSLPGDELHLEDSFSFSPTFWTDASAAPGAYFARFQLTDESETYGDSGVFEFRFDVAPIPEPSAFAALAGLATLALAAARRRQRG